MPAEDPWSWTVDELVAEVCHSTSLYQAVGYEVQDRSTLTALEHQLRGQKVTGSTFLTVLDTRALRTELKIHDLGQRTALYSIIELLRRRSSLYRQHLATLGVNSLVIRDEHHTHSKSLSNTPADAVGRDATGHKRRKVAHVTTQPLPATVQPLPRVAGELHNHDPVGETVADTGAWDHLLRWQELDGDQEVDMADLDDSEIEDQNELGDSLEEEVILDHETVQEDPPHVSSKLSHDEIVNIINERIEYYTHLWEPNKGVLKGEEISYNPEQMWEEAEAAGLRQRYMVTYEAELAYYRQRLDELCDHIIKFPGSNADQVRRQCINLELTVDSMELAEWLSSIYRLEPESDSDGGGETGPSSTNTTILERKPQLSLLNYRPEGAIEVIDLDSSPPTSANEDEPISHEFQPTSPSRPRPPNSIITDTIEPNHDQSHTSIPGLQLEPMTNLGDEPEHASIATVQRWKWSDLTGTQDRKRIVSKAVLELRGEDREQMRGRLKFVRRATLAREMNSCIDMLSRGDINMLGVLPRDLPKIRIMTSLFFSWWFCDQFSHRIPQMRQLEELAQCSKEDNLLSNMFLDYLSTLMSTTFSKEALQHPLRPSQSEVIDLVSDDEEMAPPPSTAQREQASRIFQGSQEAFAIVLD